MYVSVTAICLLAGAVIIGVWFRSMANRAAYRRWINAYWKSQAEWQALYDRWLAKDPMVRYNEITNTFSIAVPKRQRWASKAEKDAYYAIPLAKR